MYDSKSINYTIHQDGVRVYDRTFAFPPRGSDDHYAKQAEALNVAKNYGAQVLNALETKKGRPLTARERLSGRLELRTDHRPLAARMANEALIQSQPEPSSDNPHRSRLAELEGRAVPFRASERAQLRRRIQQTKSASDQWEADIAKSEAIDARNNDPAVKLMRECSDLSLRRTLLDKKSTAVEVRERQALADRVAEDSIEPAEYRRLRNELDNQFFARLDAQAAGKKAEADQFTADAAVSKDFAAILRGSDE